MKRSALLDQVLAPGGVSVRFQPIVTSVGGGWRLHALEGLIRGPEGTNLHSADVLFAYARRKRAEVAVDRTCVGAILRAATPFAGTRLAVNVHATTLESDPGFVDFLIDSISRSAFDPSAITVEIVEQAGTTGRPEFAAALTAMRRHGISIALDDVGLGYSNYRMLLDVQPDYLKIDRYLVAGCHEDAYRRAIVASIGDLAARVGACAIVEGVDNVPDLETVLASHVYTVQGFLFSPPATPESLSGVDALANAVGKLPPRPDSRWRGITDWLRVVADGGLVPQVAI